MVHRALCKGSTLPTFLPTHSLSLSHMGALGPHHLSGTQFSQAPADCLLISFTFLLQCHLFRGPSLNSNASSLSLPSISQHGSPLTLVYCCSFSLRCTVSKNRDHIHPEALYLLRKQTVILLEDPLSYLTPFSHHVTNLGQGFCQHMLGRPTVHSALCLASQKESPCVRTTCGGSPEGIKGWLRRCPRITECKLDCGWDR